MLDFQWVQDLHVWLNESISVWFFYNALSWVWCIAFSPFFFLRFRLYRMGEKLPVKITPIREAINRFSELVHIKMDFDF